MIKDYTLLSKVITSEVCVFEMKVLARADFIKGRLALIVVDFLIRLLSWEFRGNEDLI